MLLPLPLPPPILYSVQSNNSYFFFRISPSSARFGFTSLSLALAHSIDWFQDNEYHTHRRLPHWLFWKTINKFQCLISRFNYISLRGGVLLIFRSIVFTAPCCVFVSRTPLYISLSLSRSFFRRCVHPSVCRFYCVSGRTGLFAVRISAIRRYYLFFRIELNK